MFDEFYNIQRFLENATERLGRIDIVVSFIFMTANLLTIIKQNDVSLMYTAHKKQIRCDRDVFVRPFLYFLCFDIWQRFMMNYALEGKNLICCQSSQSLHPLSSLDYHQVEAYRASKWHKMYF